MVPFSLTLAGDLPADDPGLQYGSNIGSLITVIIVLALIVGLIVLLIRFLAHKNNSWHQARSIRHLGGIGVGQNKSVQLVKIGNSVYVVGVGEDVRLLEKIEDQQEIEAILQSLNVQPALSGIGILSAIQKGMDSFRKTTASKEDRVSPEAESFQELFHSKMQQVGGRRARLKELLDEDDTTDGKTP